MKKQTAILLVLFAMTSLLFTKCNSKGETEKKETAAATTYGGYETPEKLGEHLVTIGGCGDCHTPKKMTPAGPVENDSLMLSGHPAKAPYPDVNRKEMQSKGIIATSDLTAWVGPWGVSFTANLTPDPATGTGNWTEGQFMTAIREGKYHGLEGSRPILPPMPWQKYKNFTNDELKAIFAFLRTIPPISNAVPPPLPPVQ